MALFMQWTTAAALCKEVLSASADTEQLYRKLVLAYTLMEHKAVQHCVRIHSGRRGSHLHNSKGNLHIFMQAHRPSVLQ